MPTALGRGQCGGHITLFFTIEDVVDDPVAQGSRGAGLCLKDGVESIAKGEDGEGELVVRFQGGTYDSTMYEDVLEELIREIPEIRSFNWELNIRMSLPASQGFGMSASGAIASAISVQRAIGIPHEECLRRSFLIAHIVERKRSSGLGDTTALSSGGVERRIAAGSPFSGSFLDRGPGISEGWDADTPVLLVWKERTGKHTSKYIDHPEWKVKISEAGASAMEIIGKGNWDSGRWLELIDRSLIFAFDSGLEFDASRTEIIGAANEAIGNSGLSDRLSTMLCMLGESVVIVPNDYLDEDDWLGELSAALERVGFSTFSSRIGP
jgi:pantoate kinase